MSIRGLILKASLVCRRQLHVISTSKTIIKPSSPTPQNLKQYNLPLYDRMVPNIYMPFIFFYPKNSQVPLPYKTTISDQLKHSLSKTLSEYYPFAGELRSGGCYVECNDKGVQFVEAQIASNLSEVLEKAPSKDEEEGYGHLFPPSSIWDNAMYSRLMVVQLNHFSCGGIAIAASLSHRLGDATTLFTFLCYWASLSSNQEEHDHDRPCFVHELLPQIQDNDDLIATHITFPEKHWITKQIVFHNSKIAQLKSDLEKQDKQDGIAEERNYTRNELVLALLYKCAILSAAASDGGAYSQSLLRQAVNMRSLIDPPLPKTSVGNLFAFNDILTTTLSDAKLNKLVRQLRKGKAQLKGGKSVEAKQIMPMVLETCKIYVTTSICNFPLYDKMDFGWGRPIKASIVDAPFGNSFFMMDVPSRDGIEATVNLEEEHMKHFIDDKELLAYASFR